MSFEIQAITDLAVILVVAAAVALIFHKLKQPIVVGYLIAGIIIGPYTTTF
jgi:CPA2 family monovalent cation:H+ antiporter-2